MTSVSVLLLILGISSLQATPDGSAGYEENLLFFGLLLHVFCIFIGSAAPQDSSRSDAPCTTSKNERGTCLELKRCKSIHDLIVANKITRTRENEEYFRKNTCGWNNNNNEPKICCANSGSSSTDGNTGNTLTPGGPTIKVKPADCGRSTKNGEKVFGGRPAELGSWPWMVALGYRKWSDPTIEFRCGASLIADEWLLTAAHCFVDTGSLQLTTARLGDLDLDNNVKDGATPIDVPINETIVHPEYFSDRRNYDVALIRLNHKVTFTPLIQPICLLSGVKYEKDEFYRRKSPFVIGWGITENGSVPTILKEVSVNVHEFEKCSEKYSRIGGKTFTDNLLCAGEPGKDSCQGDSGGPLMFVNTTEVRFYLGGIVSAGKECGTDYPGLYMKVAKFIPWIKKVTGLNF